MQRFYSWKTAGVVTALLFVVFSFGFYYGSAFERSYGNNANTIESSEVADTEINFDAFWKAWQILDEKFVAASSSDATSEQDRVWGAIQGMTNSLGDPYTTFLPPRENEIFEGTIRGSFGGVGMEVGIRNGVVTVISPLKGTPAYEAGLEPQDRIIAINGTSTQGMTIDEAVQIIRGKVGTDVTLTIVREGRSEPFDVDITRATIEVPTINTTTRDDGVFVIELYNFSAQSPQMFREALREFVESGSRELVLDLRGNAGGFLEAAVDIASWFLETGEVIVTEEYGDNRDDRIHRSKGYNLFDDYEFDMVVLVNGGSASAAEIVAGALNEQGVAQLVGTQTFGKGSVQELVEVTEDTSLKVTIARWLTPNGNSISNGGLTPDIVVEPVDPEVNATSTTAAEEGVDRQLERAVEVLLGQ